MFGFFHKKQSLFSFAFDFKRKLFALYQFGKASYKYNKIIDILDKLNLKKNLVIYSYWFLDSCYLSILLKKNYFKTLNCVVISRAHGYDLYSERNFLNFLPYQNEYLSEIDAMFPCSNYGVNYLKEKFPQYKKKIILSRLGVRKVLIPQKYRILNFFTCSNLIKLKRVELFARCFVEAAKINKNIQWYCIGDGKTAKKVRKICKNCEK